MTLRRKISWLVVFSLVAAIVAVVFQDRFLAGPVYHGAPLNVWLRLLNEYAPNTHDQARDAIRNLGPAALPLVSEWLDWKDSLLRRALTAWVASDKERLNFYPLSPGDRRRIALEACYTLGPVAQPLTPKLFALATAPNPELEAPFLIAVIGGTNAFPVLERLSTSTNKFIRAGARVSADLLRAKSPLVVSNSGTTAQAETYKSRITEYHALVLKAVVSDSNPGQSAAHQ